MVDVKAAISAARLGFHDLLEQDSPFENVRLEEVERSEDGKYWMITLGYDIAAQPYDVPNVLFSRSDVRIRQREYKLFHVNADSGDVEAIKIRKV
ncbi:MAG: hypothetical protein AAFY33_07550 [Cyanobacteria bacterium J06643_4]